MHCKHCGHKCHCNEKKCSKCECEKCEHNALDEFWKRV